MSAAKPANGAPAGFVLSTFLPYRIVALGHAISRTLARAYEGENLTMPEWRVLAVVAQDVAMAARDVAAQTPMDKMAVSRAVASLEDRGLVERRASEEDRRMQMVSLTGEGRALFERVAAIALRYEDEIFAPLSPDERAALVDTLSALEARAGDGQPTR